MIALRLAPLALLPLSLTAAANEVTLEPIKDNTLIEQSSGTSSNGAGEVFFAGKTSTGSIRRSVLAFDVAGNLPAGTTINSVILRLTVTQSSSGDEPFDLHRVTSDWGEGTSVAPGGGGAPSTTGDATWIHTFYPSNLWSTFGGDFVTAPTLSTTLGAASSYELSGPGLVADVQSMLDNPGSNFGWLIKHASEAGNQTAKRFGSREAASTSDRPQLIIDFGPPRCDSSNYCPSNPNSSGLSALISIVGDCDVTNNQTTLVASQLPPNQFGYFLNATAPGSINVSQGILCLGGGQIGRYNAQAFNSGSNGTGSILLDPANTPTPTGRVVINPGETWYFQCWFRDVNPGPVSNFTDALEVTFE